MTRSARIAGALIVATALLGAGGCSREEVVKLESKVAPPAISTAGVLKAGVDLSTPPFAGKDAGKEAGLDIDIASAVAANLGLTVEFVDVPPSEAATALAQGTVDIVLSVPPNTSSLSAMSLAGSYISNAPALFVATEGTASIEPTLSLDSALPLPIGAQQGSESFWILQAEYDSDMIKPFPTLREAIEALVAGRIGVVAGDALVGAYIARDFPVVHLAGQIGPTMPLAVAVAADNTALNDAVRAALDELAAGDVLNTLRAKWVGEFPELAAPASDEETVSP